MRWLLLGCERRQDLGRGRRPNARPAGEVREHALEAGDAMRLADDPRVDGHRQEAAAAVASPPGRAAERVDHGVRELAGRVVVLPDADRVVQIGRLGHGVEEAGRRP